MKKIDLLINDPLGLHARPAGLLAKEVRKFESKVTIVFEKKKAVATQLISVMTLCVAKGSRITVEIEGPDEEETAEAMKEFFCSNVMAEEIIGDE